MNPPGHLDSAIPFGTPETAPLLGVLPIPRADYRAIMAWAVRGMHRRC